MVNKDVYKNVYITLPHVVAAKTAVTDRTEEITSLSTYVYENLTLSTKPEVYNIGHIALPSWDDHGHR